MQARFLLGPAGSGKTGRCLAEIRAELLRAPEGLRLVFLAPKQATFQLERQLLADPELPGYTRLQILSFERLAEFVLSQSTSTPPKLLGEEGRVMVLRALLARKRDELKVFHASARLPGLAQQLSLLLRELQRHQLSPTRLMSLAGHASTRPQLGDKLHDLALVLRAYHAWLQDHQLQDADCLLDLAADILSPKSKVQSPKSENSSSRFMVQGSKFEAESGPQRSALSPPSSALCLPSSVLRPPPSALPLAGLWLDGFAEMTPQEIHFLAALVPGCDRATLAFCLEGEPALDESWLSPWTAVSQTYRQCRQALSAAPGCEISVQILPRKTDRHRFAGHPVFQHLELCWSKPEPFSEPADNQALVAANPNAQVAKPTREIQRLKTGTGAQLAFDFGVPSSQFVGPRLAEALRVVICADPEAESVEAAREILRYVRTGGRYRDCAVLVRSLDGYQAVLRRVFARFQIPLFLDRREPIAHHPLAELTRFALRTVAHGWRQDDWFGALKTGLAPAEDAEIDWLENASLAHGWQGKTWHGPLMITDDASLAERGERIRQKVVPPFEQLAARVSASITGVEFAGALRELWTALEVEPTLEAWSAVEPSTILHPPSSNIHLTVWEQMHQWLDNLELAFPNERLTLREWLPIVEAGLSGLTVGVVPPALDQVLAGTVDRSRNPDLQLALVLGANESVFPAPPPLSVILTEFDRQAMLAHGVMLGLAPRQHIGHERYYGYIACTRARRRLVLTAAARNAAGEPLNPSPFLAHLQRLFPTLNFESAPLAGDWSQAEHACELVAPLLASLNQTGPSAKENALPAKAVQALAALPALAPALAKARRFAAIRVVRNLPPELAERMYGPELQTSVSALEDFAACPFKFFAARGLRAEERLEFEVDPRERGRFQHEILQQFHQAVQDAGRRWRDVPPAEARELVAGIGEALLPGHRNGLFQSNEARAFTARALIAAAQSLVQTLVEWMPQYGFDPESVEVGFGLPNSALPPWRLDLDHGHALALRGRIDRIDLHRPADGGPALAVVIDYKSRPRKLEAVKIESGLDLQLLSYLAVLSHLAGSQSVFHAAELAPAGVFYVSFRPAQGSVATRAQALKDGGQIRKNGYLHVGRFNARWLRVFDNRGGNQGDQFKYSVNVNGEFSKRGNDALPPDQFAELLQTVKGHLHRIGAAIYAGDVSVSPFRLKSEKACDYCDYRAMCRFDPWVEPYRQLRSRTQLQPETPAKPNPAKAARK